MRFSSTSRVPRREELSRIWTKEAHSGTTRSPGCGFLIPLLMSSDPSRSYLVNRTTQKKESFTPNIPDSIHRAPSIKHHPKSQRYYFDVGIGSVCLSGADTGGAYCLLEANLAPGTGVPRHTHTREDEAYFVLAGELEVTVGETLFVLRPGDTLVAPRDIPHQIRNSGAIENHYLLIFWPSGLEEFLSATAIPAPDDAVAPTEPPAVAVRNVHELAAKFGILFDGASLS
jgi:mannose-6-phosphate isomerase-like protein (cupin superfamily)